MSNFEKWVDVEISSFFYSLEENKVSIQLTNIIDGNLVAYLEFYGILYISNQTAIFSDDESSPLFIGEAELHSFDETSKIIKNTTMTGYDLVSSNNVLGENVPTLIKFTALGGDIAINLLSISMEQNS